MRWISVGSTVPGLISSAVETLELQQSGKGAYSLSSSPFVVLIGKFTETIQVRTILRSFFHGESALKDLQIVFLSRDEMTDNIRVLINNPVYRSRVTFLQGTAVSRSDFKRVHLQVASAVFVCAYRFADPQKEDEQNILRAWSFDDYAPLTPSFVYHRLPGSSSYLHRTTSACMLF